MNAKTFRRSGFPGHLNAAIIMSLAMLFVSPTKVEAVGPIATLIGEILLGKVIRATWNGNEKRGPVVGAIRTHLGALESKVEVVAPEFAPAIAHLKGSVNDKTTYAQFRELALESVSRLKKMEERMYTVENTVDQHTREIHELQARVLALELEVFGPQGDLVPQNPNITTMSNVKEIHVKDGYRVYDRPSTQGKLLKVQNSEETINVRAWRISEGKVFYISDWSYQNMLNGKSPNYMLLNN